MIKKISFFLILICILASCRNEKDKKETTLMEKKIDSLSYQYDSVVVYSKNTVKIDNQTDTTKASISFPIFKNESLNSFLKRQVFDYFSKEEQVTSYQDIANSFIRGYDSFYATNKDRQQAWFLMITIKVAYQKRDYIALEYVNSDYSGGAHPNTYFSYINYNSADDKAITLDSLISKGQMPKLLKIAETTFRKNEKLSPTASLEENYFFEKGKFALAQNFYVRKDGLVFLYNPYEIKPYVAGLTELVIPFAQLNGIAKPNTILSSKD